MRTIATVTTEAPERASPWAYRERWTSPPPPTAPDTGKTYTVIVGGRLAASVALTGALGSGKRMVLNDEVWRHVERLLGGVWGLRETPSGSVYVVGRRKASAGPGLPATPVLARWIARAGVGEVVTYRDGDSLNLMAANLAVVGREEFMRGL